MQWTTYEETPKRWAVTPNLLDYEQARTTFSWDAVQRDLNGLPDRRGLNIAHEAVDRHAVGQRRNHLALRWLGKRGEIRDFTYAELAAQSNRFANVLHTTRSAAKASRVFLLAGRIPELYISALGTLKNRSVFCPLFSAFGPEPIRQRLSIGDARVLVTTAALYKRKVADIRASSSGSPARPPRLARPKRRTRFQRRTIFSSSCRKPTIISRSQRLIPKTSRSCTLPVAPPANRKARCMCIKPSSRTT